MANRKKMSYVKNLTDDQIREMFMLRSKGMTLKRIAARFNLATETSRRVLNRTVRPEVVVPDNVVKTASTINRTYGKTKPRKTCSMSRAKAIAAFCEAVTAMEQAEIECLKHGITKDSIELIASSLRDN